MAALPGRRRHAISRAMTEPGPPEFLPASDRALLRIEGDDARAFLQGLISNDVNKAAPDRAIWAAFLTPQGKYLHDFFIVEWRDALYLDCERARRDDLARRLSRFRLRSKVTIAAEDGLDVVLLHGPGALAALNLEEEAGRGRPFGPAYVYADPRHAGAGARALAPPGADAAFAAAGFVAGAPSAYDRRRLALGLPDGSRDLEIEKSILLENGFDELHGVDWQKGCYMGQELTARTHYRALIKKRLVPVHIAGPAPAPGTPVMAGETEAGTMRSAAGDLGLALLRLEALERAPFAAGAARLTPILPEWMKRPAPAPR
jgi:transferase CAF17, mitochondrial